jgi:glc operon protein GlcG
MFSVVWTFLMAGQMLAAPAAATGAAAAPAPPPAAVTFFTADQLRQAIETAPKESPGNPGLRAARLAATPAWQVMEVRRSGTQSAEVHAAMADIWYVLRGEATLVTGGSLTGAGEVGPGEMRGSGVAGGEERPLHGGDVVIIQPGIPHWISKVQGEEIVYLIVKVPAAR